MLLTCGLFLSLGLLGEIPLVMGTASIPSSAPDLLLPVAAEHTEIPPAGWLTDACAYGESEPKPSYP